MKILFFHHGWQPTLGGVKPTYLPTLPDDDFAATVCIAHSESRTGEIT